MGEGSAVACLFGLVWNLPEVETWTWRMRFALLQPTLPTPIPQLASKGLCVGPHAPLQHSSPQFPGWVFCDSHRLLACGPLSPPEHAVSGPRPQPLSTPGQEPPLRGRGHRPPHANCPTLVGCPEAPTPPAIAQQMSTSPSGAAGVFTGVGWGDCTLFVPMFVLIFVFGTPPSP